MADSISPGCGAHDAEVDWENLTDEGSVASAGFSNASIDFIVVATCIPSSANMIQAQHSCSGGSGCDNEPDEFRDNNLLKERTAASREVICIGELGG